MVWLLLWDNLSFLLLSLIPKRSQTSLEIHLKIHLKSEFNGISLTLIFFEGTEARDVLALSYSIFSSVFQFLVTLGGIELLGVRGGVSKDPLSLRRGSSSRRVYDFNCRKFDIKCIKENVENISGFPVTAQ